MPDSKEMSSYYKRVLLMLKEIEQDNSNMELIRRHIRAIQTEMDAEDAAYVEKMLRER